MRQITRPRYVYLISRSVQCHARESHIGPARPARGLVSTPPASALEPAGDGVPLLHLIHRQTDAINPHSPARCGGGSSKHSITPGLSMPCERRVRSTHFQAYALIMTHFGFPLTAGRGINHTAELSLLLDAGLFARNGRLHLVAARMQDVVQRRRHAHGRLCDAHSMISQFR